MIHFARNHCPVPYVSLLDEVDQKYSDPLLAEGGSHVDRPLLPQTRAENGACGEDVMVLPPNAM